MKFDVEASVSIKGTFSEWDATLTFTSPDVTTGVWRSIDYERNVQPQFSADGICFFSSAAHWGHS